MAMPTASREVERVGRHSWENDPSSRIKRGQQESVIWQQIRLGCFGEWTPRKKERKKERKKGWKGRHPASTSARRKEDRYKIGFRKKRRREGRGRARDTGARARGPAPISADVIIARLAERKKERPT